MTRRVVQNPPGLPPQWPLVDRFIAGDIARYEHRERLYKARALVIVALAHAASMTLVTLALLLVREQLSPLEWLPLLSLLAAAGLFGILLVMRTTGSLQVGGNLYGFAATLALVALILATGGIEHSPFVPWWPLIVIFCFIIAGLKTTARWLIVGLGISILTILVDTRAITPSLLRDDVLEAGFRISATLAGLSLLAILWFFDFYHESLLKRLQLERDNALFAAAHDPLTGLCNRKSFEQQLLRIMERQRLAGGLHGLVMIDLDGFKGVNDALGHKAGDKLLVAIAERMQQDIRHSDLCARLGGDEFGALLFDLRKPEDLRPIVEKLHRAITTTTVLDDGTEVAVGASMGVALLPQDGDSFKSLLHCADQAMYEAKASRQPYCFYRDLPAPRLRP